MTAAIGDEKAAPINVVVNWPILATIRRTELISIHGPSAAGEGVWARFRR
jgi:hypothetical protein